MVRWPLCALTMWAVPVCGGDIICIGYGVTGGGSRGGLC